MGGLRRAVLFLGGALLAGTVAGIIVPVLAIDGLDRPDRGAAVAASGGRSAGPSMPDLVGERLDRAEERLDARGIRHDTEGGGLFGVIVGSSWEVCDTQPSAGERVRDVALLAVERPGEC